MTKFSLTTTLLLASMALISFSQDCNNPLLARFGLPGLDAPESGADLPFCADLQAAETCCSADTVAAFQDRANEIIDDLNNHAAGRDLYLAQLRNKYLDRFNDILEDIREDHQNDLQTIRTGNATIADGLEEIINNARQVSNDSRNINNQFVGGLDEYQRARSECFNTALQVQTSGWCLACNPNWADLGVDADGGVTFSEGLCQAISDACAPYFNRSAEFNPLFSAREAYWNLGAVARYLKNHTTNGVLNAWNIPQDPYNPLSSQLATTVPEEWVGSGDAGSAAVCQDLWADDAQLARLLNFGDNEAPVDNEETVVIPEEVDILNEEVQIVVDDGSRLLQDEVDANEGVWAPDLTATGLDFAGIRLDSGDFFGASDYSDYFNQTQNASDLTDNDTDNNLTDHTDHDLFDRSD